MSVALKYAKSLLSYNPYPTACTIYLPLWHPALSMQSFESIDGHHHVGTVTGATWSKAGYTFDGEDDKIVFASCACLDNLFDGGGTVAAWINAASGGEGDAGRIFSKEKVRFFVNDESGSAVRLTFYQVTDGVNGQWDTNGRVVTCGTSTFVAMTYNADAKTNDPIIYVNESSVLKSESGTPGDTRTSDAGTNLKLGDNLASDSCFDGVIEEYWEWNRILPATALTYIYNATKHRH